MPPLPRPRRRGRQSVCASTCTWRSFKHHSPARLPTRRSFARRPAANTAHPVNRWVALTRECQSSNRENAACARNPGRLSMRGQAERKSFAPAAVAPVPSALMCVASKYAILRSDSGNSDVPKKRSRSPQQPSVNGNSNRFFSYRLVLATSADLVLGSRTAHTGDLCICS